MRPAPTASTLVTMICLSDVKRDVVAVRTKRDVILVIAFTASQSFVLILPHVGIDGLSGVAPRTREGNRHGSG